MLESEQSQHYYVVSSIFASTVKIVYLPVIAVCVCVLHLVILYWPSLHSLQAGLGPQQSSYLLFYLSIIDVIVVTIIATLGAGVTGNIWVT